MTPITVIIGATFFARMPKVKEFGCSNLTVRIIFSISAEMRSGVHLNDPYRCPCPGLILCHHIDIKLVANSVHISGVLAPENVLYTALHSCSAALLYFISASEFHSAHVQLQ